VIPIRLTTFWKSCSGKLDASLVRLADFKRMTGNSSVIQFV
jgi:hypothetical protein